MSNKILFICKQGNKYFNVGDEPVYTKKHSGLFNSTRFIVKGLRHHGVHADIVIVTDNNDIDREVAKHRPNMVIIEALWVTPDKFDILKALHPNVDWFCHLHSDIPFLAQEGIAISWLEQYASKNVATITNCKHTFEALSVLLPQEELFFLPNVYLNEPRKAKLSPKEHINIGCFGALRPMKNQLLAALSAIKFAAEIGKPLKFHINSGRVELGGEPVLKNIKLLFDLTPGAELIQHAWFDPEDFIDFMVEHIDLGLQISMTETFCVVGADMVTAGIPIVASSQLSWISGFCQAKSDDICDVVNKMHRVKDNWALIKFNQYLLEHFNKNSLKEWIEFTS